MATPTKTITLEPFHDRTVKSHRVEMLTGTWEEGTWEHVPFLWCNSATWSSAPAISTAELEYDSGWMQRQGEAAAGIRAKLTGLDRVFIRIRFETDSLDLEVPPEEEAEEPTTEPVGGDEKPLYWIGTIEVTIDELLGTFKLGNDTVTNLRQTIQAFGVEKLVAETPFLLSVFGIEGNTERPLTFNYRDDDGILRGNLWRGGFSRGTSGYLPEVKLWRSSDVATYLTNLYYFDGRHELAPKTFNFRFLFTETDLVDRPVDVLPTEGRTIGEIINQIWHQDVAAGWRMVCDPDGDEIYHRDVWPEPFSMLAEDVSVDTVLWKANPNRYHFDFRTDRDVQAQLKTTHLGQFDRVILRGAHRTSTCTLGSLDGFLKPLWPEELQDLYDAGASTQAGYGAADTSEQQRRNAEARAADKLLPVYRRFGPEESWELLVHGGLGPGNGSDDTPVFPRDNDPESSADVCWTTLTMLPTLMLREGMDYTNVGTPDYPIDPKRVSDGPYNYLAPLLLMHVIPGPEEFPSTGWVDMSKHGLSSYLETINEDENHRFSVRVEVPHRDKALLVHVQGQPQHAIAGSANFEPLDVDEKLGGWSYDYMMATVTFEEDRYCEEQWPPNSAIDTRGRELRTLLYYVGEEYRKDYIVPQTVIGLDPETGNLVRSTGGFARDDSLELLKRATLLYEWKKRPRHAFEFSTSRIMAAPRVGDMILSIGDPDDPTEIRAVVTEITITIGSQEQTPRMHFKTSHAELDPLQGMRR